MDKIAGEKSLTSSEVKQILETKSIEKELGINLLFSVDIEAVKKLKEKRKTMMLEDEIPKKPEFAQGKID